MLTAVPFLRRMTWRLPDTYHSAGHGRGTATLKFYEGRGILSGKDKRYLMSWVWLGCSAIALVLVLWAKHVA